jgi:DnaK suppressor protein
MAATKKRPAAGGAKKAAKKAPAKKAPAKKAAPVKASQPKARPWSKKDLADARAALLADVAELREQMTASQEDLADLIADSVDAAGDDQADAGTKTLEREQEMALGANVRLLLEQSYRALRRIDDGTYGTCTSCGRPIPKGRLKALPHATLCLECKQREERY